MAKTCKTISELIEYLKTLPAGTAVNPQQARAGIRKVIAFTPLGGYPAVPELYFDDPVEWNEEEPGAVQRALHP